MFSFIHTLRRAISGAMFQLKRKKMLEKRTATIQNYRLNLESQIFALENANTNQQMVGAISAARDELSAITSDAQIEQIETLQEDMQVR